MKPKTLVLLIVAVGCGLLAAYLTANMGPRPSTIDDTQLVYVPKQMIPVGKKIDKVDDYFVKAPFPRAIVQPDWITDDKQLKDAVVSKAMKPAIPVTKLDLDSGTPILQLLPSGYRAIAIPANVTSATGGFILPGNRVDVMCSIAPANNPNLKLTKTFLYNVLVLAVNQEDDPKLQERKTINPNVITLALKLDDAERVSWVVSGAGGTPTIHMALRRPGDEEDKTTTKGVKNPFRPGEEPEGFGSKDTAPGNPSVELVMVPRAKKDIEISVRVNRDNFDDYFEQVGVPLEASRTILLREDLIAKGAPVYTRIPQGCFPTGKHFDITEEKGKLELGRITICNGKEQPVTKLYDKRTGLILGENEMPAPAEKPAPAGGGEGK
jgi:Flp pilus assembly protein CpaB